MGFKVNIEIDKELTVAADYDTVFNVLANVPESAGYFPKVDTLTDLGDNTFRWEMEKVGVGDHAIQSIYASKYESDAETGDITWTPVKGEGNGLVAGSWKISEADGGTHLAFSTKAELTLGLPGLLKLAISPIVKHEFNAMVDTYFDNLEKAFS